MTVGPFLVEEPQKPGGVFYVFASGPFGRPVIVATCGSKAEALRLSASLNAAEFADEVAARAAELEADDFEEWIRGRVQEWRQDQNRPDEYSPDGLLSDADLEDERAAKAEAEQQAAHEPSIQEVEPDEP